MPQLDAEFCVTVIAEMLLKVRSTPFTVDSDAQSIALLPVMVNESEFVVAVAEPAARVSVGGTPSMMMLDTARITSVAGSPIVEAPYSI